MKLLKNRGKRKVVESPGKLVRKGSEARLTKDLSLRKVDSVFPGNGTKNVIAQFVG